MAAPAGTLILPASDYYLAALRAGSDPFQELARFADERDFATCALVDLEVCRGLRDPELRQRCRARFASMVQQRFDQAIVEKVLRLAQTVDESSPGLPISTLTVAACAFQLGAAVLTQDKRFNSIPELTVINSLA